MANQANSLSHTKWMCKYHIVFTIIWFSIIMIFFLMVLTIQKPLMKNFC